MLGTAFAQLSVAGSVALGVPLPRWALDHLVTAALGTRHEFGTIESEATQVVSGPALDAASRSDMQLRRFRTQAERAASETVHYPQQFARLGVDPARIRFADIAQLPPTSKIELQADPAAFTSRRRRPALLAESSGTTGRPVQVAFSQRELDTFTALSALGFLISNEIRPDDVVCLAGGPARTSIATYTLERTCDRIGAMRLSMANLPPAAILSRLSVRTQEGYAGPPVTVLQGSPSLVGALVELGRELGYGPRDFAIRRILSGGEILTTGLQTRLRALFGDIPVSESYGMTETFGAGSRICEGGHMHFHPAHALIEIIDPATYEPVGPDDVGSLVVTPLPPFRETTLLLRYDTQDLVRSLAKPPTCELRAMPAVSRVLGKHPWSVHHATGCTVARDLLEALEAIEDVPLPARCGMWSADGGVGVELLVRADAPATRERVADRLEAAGVPVRELHLVTHRAHLRNPLPVRTED